MTTKKEVLNLLETNNNQYFSGEELAKRLNVSRSAIWKAIKSLQKSGYNIAAVTNKGYALLQDSDVLSYDEIKKLLHTEVNLRVENIVTSTNSLLVQEALNGQKEGTVLIAGMQTNGKGRIGRSFYSPAKTGVYLSVLLRPTTKTPSEATNITAMAAVSACEAIEKVAQIPTQIKWVNDIYINNKKVCGILTEASISMESKKMDYVVMGIGFNTYIPEEGFPDDIKEIAGSIYKEILPNGRNKLVATFIDSFMTHYYNWDNKAIYKAYKDRSIVLGKEVAIISSNPIKKVFVEDINDNFELIVSDEGTRKTIGSGEVSVRL